MKHDQLTQLGFSPKESAVYLTVLELGDTSVSEIAHRARLNRTTLYDILPVLVNRGLIIKVGGTTKETYSPQPPEKLLSMLEQQSSKLKDQINLAKTYLPELRMIGASASKPKLEMYEGHEGIKKLYDLTLMAQEDIRSFGSADSLELFDPEYLHDYYRRRAEKKIFIRAILGDTPSSRQYQKNDTKLRREIRLVGKEELNIRPEVYIYDDQVIFFSLNEGYGIRVISLDIANALKCLHNLAWKQARGKTSK